MEVAVQVTGIGKKNPDHDRPRLSVVVPVRNGERTIGRCLGALARSSHPSFEVVVVDDHSTDRTLEIVHRLPCRLVRLAGGRRGAAAARNAGAAAARGQVLFFTDADCIVLPDTLANAEAAVAEAAVAGTGQGLVAGGTYTAVPADASSFFSRFQSVFVHHAEGRNPGGPDYLATHALVMTAAAFRASGGFAEGGAPILEDVEFCHRLRRQGFCLRFDPAILVRHDFGYGLGRSLANAARKARYWVRYSLENRDLLRDSGTASRALKVHGCVWLLSPWLAAAGNASSLALLLLAWAGSVWLNRGLLAGFVRAGGWRFAWLAAGYYLFAYPAPVWCGAVAGGVEWLARRCLGRRPDWNPALRGEG